MKEYLLWIILGLLLGMAGVSGWAILAIASAPLAMLMIAIRWTDRRAAKQRQRQLESRRRRYGF